MMRNVSMMYLRPGSLYKEFIVQTESEGVGTFGRPKKQYGGEQTIFGALAEASQNVIERWKQLQHPVTHTIEQAGSPAAKAGDKLVLGDRVFLVHGVDECGSLGIATIYYAEERADVN